MNLNNIPPEIEKLRKALRDGVIDPRRQYKLDLGNGEIASYTGAELIETMEGACALADAQNSGDLDVATNALKRLGLM